MTPFNKILNSIRYYKRDITSTDIASLTDDEINEINKCYAKKHNKNQYFNILYCIDSKRERIGINHGFMFDYMKIDEYIYISDLHPIIGDEWVEKKEKIEDYYRIQRVTRPRIYVKRMNKFQKWLKNDTV